MSSHPSHLSDRDSAFPFTQITQITPVLSSQSSPVPPPATATPTVGPIDSPSPISPPVPPGPLRRADALFPAPRVSACSLLPALAAAVGAGMAASLSPQTATVPYVLGPDDAIPAAQPHAWDGSFVFEPGEEAPPLFSHTLFSQEVLGAHLSLPPSLTPSLFGSDDSLSPLVPGSYAVVRRDPPGAPLPRSGLRLPEDGARPRDRRGRGGLSRYANDAGVGRGGWGAGSGQSSDGVAGPFSRRLFFPPAPRSDSEGTDEPTPSPGSI